MEKVVHENGVVLEWDDTLTVGELITAYRDGYHILTRFEFREGNTPLVYYINVVKPNGVRVKKPGATLVCDASYVRRVSREDVQRIYEAEVNAAILKRDNLLNFTPR